MKWLRDGLEGVQLTAENSPTEEIGEGEMVIGELTDLDLQKLFAFRDTVREELRHLLRQASQIAIAKAMDASHPDQGAKDHDRTCTFCRLSAQGLLLRSKAELVDELFWTGVRAELSPEDLVRQYGPKAGGIGIRKDWKIVATRPSNPLISGLKLAIPLGVLLGDM